MTMTTTTENGALRPAAAVGSGRAIFDGKLCKFIHNIVAGMSLFQVGMSPWAVPVPGNGI